MLQLAYDLHIHSVASPCADRENTVNNILNMAYIKDLKLVSITDHNCCFHQRIAEIIANQLGILYLPGIEVQTKEEVHLLCYFSQVEQAESFGTSIFDSLPKQDIVEEILGEQWICDLQDRILRKEKKNLLNSSSYSIEDIYKMVPRYGGVIVPAHIDKKNHSIISQMGFIPLHWQLETVELSKNAKDSFIKEIPFSKEYKILRNSDAHQLSDINEPEHFVEISHKDREQVISFLEGRI